jgi:enoyl-[acyl-carrier protein] reductase II
MSLLFPSKFPILSAAMNKVSNAKLAIAVHNAGAFPSISAFNFIRYDGIDYNEMLNEFKEFKASTKSKNLLLSISAEKLSVQDLLFLYDEEYLTHLEIICESIRLTGPLNSSELDYFKKLKNRISPLKEKGVIIVLKCLSTFFANEIYKNFRNDIFDGFIIKGINGAGSIRNTNSNTSLEKDIIDLLRKNSDIKIVASGGISTPEDVRTYLNAGADSIAIGTLLAMSLESIISTETKKEILKRKDETLEIFKESSQRAMIFSKIETDDYNHTHSLERGIKNPCSGHVFLGSGVKDIDKIKSVSCIIKYLTDTTF